LRTHEADTTVLQRLPLDELIAVAAVIALAMWGGLSFLSQGAVSLRLGGLDPAAAIGNPSLTVADLPLVLMLITGGAVLVTGLLRDLIAGRFGSDLLAGISMASCRSAQLAVL